MKYDISQAKKDKVVSELAEVRRSILDAASSLSPERQDEIFLSAWSVKDLLAHLVGWDFTNIEAIKEILAGQVPNFYSFYDRDWKTFNARLVKEHKRDNFAELLSSVERSHQKLVDFLTTIPAAEFGKDRGLRSSKGSRITIACILQAEIDDEKIHHEQVKEYALTTE